MRPTVTTLAGHRLFLVGENHGASSSKRQEYEKVFCADTVGGGYWDETDFPSIKNDVVNPAKSGDSHKLRAIHGTVMTLERVSYLSRMATLVMPDEDEYDDLGDAAASILEFYSRDIPKFVDEVLELSDRRTWVPTSDREKETAKLWTVVDDDLRDLRDDLSDALTDAIARAAAGKHDAVAALHAAVAANIGRMFVEMVGKMPGILAAAGVPHDQQAGTAQELAEISQDVMVRRSRRMLRAAENSGLTGVWKIGGLHIADILDPSVIAEDPVTVGIMAETDFDGLFLAWVPTVYGVAAPWDGDRDVAAARLHAAARSRQTVDV